MYSVNENEMQAAFNAVLNGGTVYSVSKERGINLMTLKRYVRKCQLNEEETSLSDHLLRASKLHNGLSTKTTRKLAYEFAMTLSKRIPKSWKSLQIAGKQWLRGFMLRRNDLSLRNPEATSMARATAFNRYTVG